MKIRPEWASWALLHSPNLTCRQYSHHPFPQHGEGYIWSVTQMEKEKGTTRLSVTKWQRRAILHRLGSVLARLQNLGEFGAIYNKHQLNYSEPLDLFQRVTHHCVILVQALMSCISYWTCPGEWIKHTAFLFFKKTSSNHKYFQKPGLPLFNMFTSQIHKSLVQQHSVNYKGYSIYWRAKEYKWEFGAF